MTRLALAPLVAATCLLPACADEPVTTGETTGLTDASSGTGGGTAPDPTTTSATSASTGDEEPGPVYARGLRLTRVTATQGVQVEIVRDGVEVPGDAYAARLITGRKTVLRADWLLHAEFTPRALIGRLTLWTPSGETRAFEFKTTVAGPSNDADLFTTFSWELPAELVAPGLQYRVEALEADPAQATGEVSDPPPVLPLAGRGTLVVQDTRMEMKVTLVPIRHVFGGMTCEPLITDADLNALREAMEQHNPVERVILSQHPPFEYTASIGTDPDGFVPILTELGILRAKDKPADNEYYYALITSCDSYPGGLLGQAYGIPDAPTPMFAFQRIAAGRYLGSGAKAAETFVHEIGHTQGRRHVRCSGSEAGVDPDYPHPNGRIGAWGYGIHDTQVRSPTSFRDYMTYCPNSWVSDYGWEMTYDTIVELSSWDQAGAPAPVDKVPIVVVTLMPSGRTHAYTTLGGVPQRGRDAGAVVEFALAGGAVHRATASLQAIPDGEGVSVVAALPAASPDFESLTIRTGDEVRATIAAKQVVRSLRAE